MSSCTRVPKALILGAVEQGVGGSAAGRMAASKKAVMVHDAERRLQGTGWLPAMLSLPAVDGAVPDDGAVDSSHGGRIPATATP